MTQAIQDKKNAPLINDITLKSIDTSVVNWFKEDFSVIINGKKTPVVYATAERWARAQKEKGFRDESGILILPIISVRRTIPESYKERYVPESEETNITLARRISTIPISENERQPINKTIFDKTYSKTKDSIVFEILQIPFPSFINVDYEIIIWTSYMTHQNIEQENIFKQFKGGKQYFKAGDYYFFGFLQTITDNSNFEDFSDKEKIIKYNFKLQIQAYLIDKSKVKSYRTSTNSKINIKINESSILLK